MTTSVESVPLPVAAAHRRQLWIGLYLAAAFLYWMSLYYYVSTLSVYAQTVTNDTALIGVFLSMYGLWQAFLRIPLGIAADWIGRRKPFIIAGFVFAALGAWMMASSGNITGLVNGRAMTGLAAATWVPLVVVFSSFFPPEEAIRATTLITFANSLGRLLATSLNGKLNELGGYPLAFNFAIITALVAIMIVLAVPETRRKSKAPALGDLGRLFINRSVMVPSILYLVSQYATWASIFGFLPNLAKQLLADGNTVALLVPLNIGVMTLSNLVAGAVIRRIGSRNLVVLTFIFLAGGVAAAALASNLALVFVAAACIGVANGIGYPIMMGMSIEKIPNETRATAMGIFQATYAIGMFGGPWLSGILAKSLGGLQPMFGVTAFFTLVLGLFGTRWLTSAGKSGAPTPTRDA